MDMLALYRTSDNNRIVEYSSRPGRSSASRIRHALLIHADLLSLWPSSSCILAKTDIGIVILMSVVGSAERRRGIRATPRYLFQPFCRRCAIKHSNNPMLDFCVLDLFRVLVLDKRTFCGFALVNRLFCRILVRP